MKTDQTERKYVWIPDEMKCYKKAYIINEQSDINSSRSDSSYNDNINTKMTTVNCNNTILTLSSTDIYKTNPSKFDMVDDLSDLSYLNEPSVLHNLITRYNHGYIYTYSGLFLIAINPYRDLNIYNSKYISKYFNNKKSDVEPHIYGVANEAYINMINNKENQSILITGESGAGKTENTKRVIIYLSSISRSLNNNSNSFDFTNNNFNITNGFDANIFNSSNANDISSVNISNLDTSLDKIMITNYILESFGNAKTIKNDNSSRFGKFIQIKFRNGAISGAHIEKYLLEKSRVVYQNQNERNYHIFYQILSCKEICEKYYLNQTSYKYLTNGINITEQDKINFKLLRESFKIFNINEDFIFRILSSILLLGEINVVNDKNEDINIEFNKESTTKIPSENISTTKNISISQNNIQNNNLKITNIEKVKEICNLLQIPYVQFINSLLNPVMKVSNEKIRFTRNKEQVYSIIKGLSKILYDKLFNQIINDINKNIYSSDNLFIGVLDIAGFEIYKENGFEQLCINYTNEKLQQFFNHHMFILEQEIYKEENIEWNYIDFGLDLQPLIDLIESSNPIGILSYLDEECVMPKGGDETFLYKVRNMCNRESIKNKNLCKDEGLTNNYINGYNMNRDFNTYNNLTDNKIHISFDKKENNSFILNHYAGQVNYTVTDWISKNKDPNFEFINEIINKSDNKNISNLSLSENIRQRGFFRTVSQKHKEQLNLLMCTLNKTNPHFVRCLIPNLDKSGDYFNNRLMLDQLKCNGVLEGIRISRMGYPSRMSYEEFVDRYSLFIDVVKENKNNLLNSNDEEECVNRNTTELKTLNKFSSESESLKDLTYSTNESTKVKKIIEKLNLKTSQYKLGRTKIFFRQGILADIEDLRDIKIGEIMKTIQSRIREKLEIYKSNLQEIKKSSSKLILKNAKIYLNLSRWAWWKLYLKVKPLLDVNKKENLINDLNKKIKNNLQEIENLKEKLNEKEICISEQNSEIENLKLQIIYSKELAEGIRQEFNNEKEKLRIEIEEKEKIRNEMFELKKLKDELDHLKKLNLEINEKVSKFEDEKMHLNNEKLELNNGILKLKDENVNLNKYITELKNEKTQIMSENSNLKNALLKDNKEKDVIVKDLEEKKEQEIRDLEKQVKNMEIMKQQEIRNLENKKILEVENLEKKLNILNLELNDKQKQIKNSEIEYEKNKNIIAQKNEKINEYENEICKMEKTINELSQNNLNNEKIINQKNEEINIYKNKCNSLNEEINDLNYENQKYESIINKLEKNIQDKDNIIRTMKLENINLNNNINKYKLEITNLDDTILKLKEHLNNNVNAIDTEKYKKINLKMHDKIKILENSNIKLLKEIDEIKNENSNLVQTKMEEFFNSEREFNIINKKLTLENTSLNYTIKSLKKELDELKGQSESSEDSQLEKLYNIIEKESTKRKEIENMLIEKEIENHNLSLQIINLTNTPKSEKLSNVGESSYDKLNCLNGSCTNISCKDDVCKKNSNYKILYENINDTINKFNEKFFNILDFYKLKLKTCQELINKNNDTINNLNLKISECKKNTEIQDSYIKELKESNLGLQKKNNLLNKNYENIKIAYTEINIENENNFNKYNNLLSMYKELEKLLNLEKNMYKDNIENIDKNINELKKSFNQKLKECTDKKNLEIRELKNLLEENEIRIVELESVKYELDCIKKLNFVNENIDKGINQSILVNQSINNEFSNEKIIEKLKEIEKQKLVMENEIERYKQEIVELKNENDLYLKTNKNKKDKLEKLNDIVNNLDLYKKSNELKIAQMEREINEYKEIVGVLKDLSVGRRKSK